MVSPPNHRRAVLLWQGVVGWTCLSYLAPLAAAIELDHETEFLTGLRSRGLYRLAARHAEGILRAESLPATARIELAIDLSQTLSEWGNSSPTAERDERWRAAHAVLADARDRAGPHPRAVLLELQDALLWYGEGDFLQKEAVLQEASRRGDLTGSSGNLSTAREKVRRAIGMLEKLAQEVDEALRRQRMSRGTAGAEDGFSIEELTSLSHNIAFVTAQALASQAETYPAKSPDRVNSLTRAVDLLASLLQRVGENELRQRAELELISAHRLLGHFGDARRLLGSVLNRTEVSAQAAAEHVRLLVAEGRTREAVAAAVSHRGKTPNSPVLLLAHLEAIVAGALAEPAQVDPREAIESATSFLAELAEQSAPRQHHQAELQVARLLAATNQEADTLATARLAAEGLYRAGRAAEAAVAFDRAAELARRQEDIETAFELAMTAAAVVHESGAAREAARRYFELAAAAPEGARAPKAHRLGLLALADSARRASETSERSAVLAEYARRVEEHLAQWPSDPTSDEVRIWLARLRLQAGDPRRAMGPLNRIGPQSEQYEASRSLLMEAYEAYAQAAETPSESSGAANEAAHVLQPVITGSENRWPTAWTDPQREVALALARLQLAYVDGGATYAQRLLSAALASPEAPAKWRHEAAGLLLVAEALLGHREQTERLMAELTTASPELKAEIVSLLVEPPLPMEDPRRRPASDIALRLIEEIGASGPGLTETVRERLAHQHARALAASGRHAAALAAYRDLVERQSGDAAVYEEYARLLAASDSPDERLLAGQVWHQIERRSKPGGERYLRARLARIRLLAEHGDTAEAKKLWRLTAAVHPDLGGEALRAQFRAVAAELGD